MKQAVSSPAAPAAIGPYSQAVVSGGVVYVSGQLPIDPATGQMPAAAADQARQSLKNIAAILEAAGSSLAQALKVGVFLTDLGDFQAVNEVYAELFAGAAFPARSTVQVAALPKGAKVEIDAVAAL
ncbi:MAG: Rid family detoxifying hydrolase [Deltaproteobacteria bacterium]|jgi:2-iminobutanoate/2-iminopropanoate deaminase|nr:Rid family detoxifying hydrolase [Deltaproteobacteria bacterium]